MSKRLQGMICAFLICAFIADGTTSASKLEKAIDVTYRDIKIMINGEELIPKDAAGNIVEPFIYNGTTYLPVRAISEAFGRDVNWNNDTSTVTVSGQPAKKMYVHDHFGKIKQKSSGFSLERANSSTYIGCIVYPMQSTMDKSGMCDFRSSLTYPAEKHVEKITGTFVAPECTGEKESSARIRIYDEKKNTLYESEYLSSSAPDASIEFEVETKGCREITIDFEGKTSAIPPEECYCRIGDLAVYTTDY